MSKRRVRRKRRARVNIKPLILAGVIIAGVITVIMECKSKEQIRSLLLRRFILQKLRKLRIQSQ